MKIKTTRRYHLMPVKMAVIKKTEEANAAVAIKKRECLCAVGGIINLYTYYKKQYGGSSKI